MPHAEKRALYVSSNFCDRRYGILSFFCGGFNRAMPPRDSDLPDGLIVAIFVRFDGQFRARKLLTHRESGF
jgi:hypothetical protein